MPTLTVSSRSLALSAAAVVAVAGAYVAGGGGAGTPAGAASAPPASDAGLLGTVTMTGEGEVVGVPDQLTFRLSVTRKRADVAPALAASSGTLRRVLAALERVGVERKDVQTTGLSVDPDYRYFNSQPPVLTGYRVRQAASVLVRDLATGGRAVAAAIEAGGNAVRVFDIGLEIGDRDELLAEARDAAIAAATAKAQQYAEATGQPLGEVLTVTEGRRASRPQVVEQAGLRDDAADRVAGAIPVRAGREGLAVSVTMVWRLATG